MPEATVIFFSPTGNTKAVCLQIAELLEKKYNTAIKDATLPEDRSGMFGKKHSGELLFAVSPVYSHGAVKLFCDFLARLNLSYDKAAVICTYGGICCGSGIRDITVILAKKGIPVVAAAEVPTTHHFALAGVKGLKGI